MPAIHTPAKLATLIAAGLSLVMLLGAAGLIGIDHHLRHGQTASLGGPFELEEANGRMVSDRDFRGKYVLIYFGYTSCPDVCPTTMADLGIALKKLGAKAEEVQPLFVTVDPERDTPEVLKSYVSAFSPRLVGLTGSPQQIAAVEKEFHVYARIEKTGNGPQDYSIDHSSVYYLMGPDGRFISVLRADQEGDDLAKTISHYLT
jgi:protein SCO1/2